MLKKSLVLSVLGILLVVASIGYVNSLENNEAKPTSHYVGLVKLGLIPNTASRLPLSNDIDTGLTIYFEDKQYRFFESRTFREGVYDYGKFFVVRLS
jgi:hypothetical protein